MTIDVDLSTPVGQVRAITGDVVEPYFVSDDMVEFMLDEYEGNTYKTAVKCVQFIVSYLARKIDQEVGEVKFSYGQQYKNYQKLLEDLQRNPAYMPVATELFTFGGTTKTEIRRVQTDSETPKKSFKSGFFTEDNTQYVDPDNQFLLSP